LYPNPAKNDVAVAVPKTYWGNLQLEIFDIQGKQVYLKNFETSSNFEKTDISNLSSGYYIVQLKSENGKVSRQKLLVQ